MGWGSVMGGVEWGSVMGGVGWGRIIFGDCYYIFGSISDILFLQPSRWTRDSSSAQPPQIRTPTSAARVRKRGRYIHADLSSSSRRPTDRSPFAANCPAARARTTYMSCLVSCKTKGIKRNTLRNLGGPKRPGHSGPQALKSSCVSDISFSFT